MYSTQEEWLAADNKKVVLFGMSGLGKTHISNMLRQSGDWYHYSIDYRIGTRYMGEHIDCLLYTSPSPRDLSTSRMPSSA